MPPRKSRRSSEPHLDPGQKVADGRRDFVAMRLEGEVSRVEEGDLRVLEITPESLCACGQEERVSVAPNGQQWRLVLAKVLLELRVHVDVARVVEEQVQLRLMRAGSGHVVVVQGVAVRRNQGRV